LKARVLVRLKQSILDAQGASVKLAGISADQARKRIEEMCGRLLANPVIEDFTVEVLG